MSAKTSSKRTDPDLFGRLVPILNGKLIRRWTVPLRKSELFYSVGTYKDCDIRIRRFRSVEPYHCILEYDGISGTVSIENRSTITGTWVSIYGYAVNSVLLAGSHRSILQDNDKIALGPPILPTSRVFVFESGAPMGKLLQQSYSVRWDEPIGVGSSAIVWKARKRLSFGVRAYRAVKALHYEIGDSERQAWIANEVKICKLLKHPNICTFHEVIEDEGSCRIFLILDLVQEGDLGKFVSCTQASGRAQDISVAADLTMQICRAVSYMHSLSIIHRDLKPTNILIHRLHPTENPTVKVIDFGLSTALADLSSAEPACGTADFAAPEVAMGHYSVSVDAWSIGAITVFMMTGQSPSVIAHVRGRTLKDILSHRTVDLCMFHDVARDDTLCIDFVKRLLQAQPEKRMKVTSASKHAWLI